MLTRFYSILSHPLQGHSKLIRIQERWAAQPPVPWWLQHTKVQEYKSCSIQLTSTSITNLLEVREIGTSVQRAHSITGTSPMEVSMKKSKRKAINSVLVLRARAWWLGCDCHKQLSCMPHECNELVCCTHSKLYLLILTHCALKIP
jgi:hypothetical protein